MRDFDTGDRFFSPEDCRRINNSYARYKGKAVYIQLSDGQYKANLYLPGTDKPWKIVNVQNDEDLDLSSPSLGFMNTGAGALYISRRPMRQWHHLTESLCTSYSPASNTTGQCAQPMFHSKEFANMIEGVYPSYRDAMKRQGNTAFFACVAFDRYFSLLFKPKINKMFYRNEHIADFDVGQKLWKLKPNFQNPTMEDYLIRLGVDFGE